MGLAIPGFAAPAAKPRRVENVSFSDLDDTTLDGDGFDGLISFDAVKQDVFSELDALGNPIPMPNDVVASLRRRWDCGAATNSAARTSVPERRCGFRWHAARI